MDKQQIVAFIEGQLATGKISKEDLLVLAGGSPHIPVPSYNSNSNIVEVSHKEESSKNLINTFYGIGAIIVLGGIAVLIGQNWEEIGFLGRVLVTLGISLATYISAFVFNKPGQSMISQVMFTISSALAPLGVYVLLSEANISYAWPYTFFTALGLSVIFGYAFLVSKRNILVLITLGFASWAYYTLVVKVFGFSYYNYNIMKWAVMLLGSSYILVGYGYGSASTATDPADAKEKKSIRDVLLGLGALSVLAAGSSIGGFFDIIFIAFIFAAFYGSVFLKSRSMLTLGALFLMGHIIKLTSKYFVDSIGWPVALIIIGFLIIGVGYMTYNLNKKYIAVR
ncbi:MAG: hypothetical protein AB198_02565 [Parcubacteria bacterium C7867-003]|nr:MAG: hypothetical protein AB198_02565 [Parcubacteria bacterium C7867-003]